jgi:carboxymethylenebutenolidase
MMSAMHEEIRTITTADGTQSVLVKRPDGDGSFPVVVMFHDGPGVRPSTHACATRIAEGGFMVAVPDRYYRKERFYHIEPEQLFALAPDSEEFKGFWSLLMGTSDEMVGADLDALLAHLDDDPNAQQRPMGVIGYCIGARSVLRAIAAHPDRFTAAVGLHPSFCCTDQADSPHLAVPAYPGELYMGLGSEDQMQSVAVNEPLAEVVATMGDRGQYVIHEGADHGFAVPGGAYLASAADPSYEAALAMFARQLR